MYGTIISYIYLMFMVSVGKYTMHGSYANRFLNSVDYALPPFAAFRQRTSGVVIMQAVRDYGPQTLVMSFGGARLAKRELDETPRFSAIGEPNWN